MLQAWLSIGYVLLLAILVLASILWRTGGPVLSIVALVVGIPLWFAWEYARPTWTTGVITGTEVRRKSSRRGVDRGGILIDTGDVNTSLEEGESVSASSERAVQNVPSVAEQLGDLVCENWRVKGWKSG